MVKFDLSIYFQIHINTTDIIDNYALTSSELTSGATLKHYVEGGQENGALCEGPCNITNAFIKSCCKLLAKAHALRCGFFVFLTIRSAILIKRFCWISIKMECPKCQFENRTRVKFCKECGANLELACSECGMIYELCSKYCDEGGHRLNERKHKQLERAQVSSPHGAG